MERAETAHTNITHTDNADTDILRTHIACIDCDTLFDMSGLHDGERAKCPVCGNILADYKEDAPSRVIAFSIAALMFLAMSCAYPFLSFKSSGLESVTTLPGTIFALHNYGMWEVALLVAAFIIVIPFLSLILILMLCVPLSLKRSVPWMVPSARIVFALQHWCMVDVFLIGVIVSLVKIAAMATVVLGVSFFAYAGFAICFTLAMASLDRLHLWIAIERLLEAEA